MLQIKEDKVPVNIKSKKQSKFNLLPEIQLDVFKCLDFAQLLDVQQASVYFKNFINEHGKVLARKKFDKLEIDIVDNETIRCYKRCKQDPQLYDYKLEEHRPCDSGMCEKTFKFFKLKPQLYEFELSKRLEREWKNAIEKQIPMFSTADYQDANTIACEVEQNYKQGKDLYCFYLSKYPKNIEEMKIARYFFQLLFNCSFHLFGTRLVVINPKMIELLFDNEITTNKHLQIHSQNAELYLCEEHNLNFAWNHLVSNRLYVGISETFDVEKSLNILFKILANGGNKFSNITYDFLNSKLYNFIIEVCKIFIIKVA
ncbi:unnamed protein product [Meloidogyne enterolobii]|uniref:Uncharacterized protein n=1 Tax=Meloidogyne enterolobii TaxID=390850 RepID=A0ACB0YZY2_MELEN